MGKINNDAGMPIGLTLEPGTYYRCTCGKSQNLPFCDGSHSGPQMPIEFTVVEKSKVYLCSCGKSENQPFCDGRCGVDLDALPR